MERSSSYEYLLIDKLTGEHKTFKSQKEIKELLGLKFGLSQHVKNGSTIAKRYLVKQIEPPYEIEVWKPRIEGYDYQAQRKAILRTIKEHHTEGICVVDESSRHNTAYYNVFLKNPSEELKEIINSMIV